jgi:hypothetical protein
MDAPGVVYSRIGYPMTVRALSGGNPTLIPYMMVLVNILAAVGGTLAIAFFFRRHGLPPALALLYGFYPGLALAVVRDLTEPLAFALAATALVVFDWRSKRRLLGAATLFGLAMLTRETVAVFPAILALGLLVGAGTTASSWRERIRWGNLARAIAFAEIAFAPLFVWRHILATALPHTATQEAFVGAEHTVVGGAAGALLSALVPFHAIAKQWPWTGADVTNLLTVLLPALIWSGIAIVLLRRKLTLRPLFVLAHVAYSLGLLAAFWFVAPLPLRRGPDLARMQPPLCKRRRVLFGVPSSFGHCRCGPCSRFFSTRSGRSSSGSRPFFAEGIGDPSLSRVHLASSTA